MSRRKPDARTTSPTVIHRPALATVAQVKLEKTARGLRTGVYMGWDGDRPTRSLDALVHEVDPGTVTTIHRHSWDAILFMVEGSGWTEVDGVRYDWKAWDAIHIPAWSWHRHGNDGGEALVLAEHLALGLDGAQQGVCQFAVAVVDLAGGSGDVPAVPVGAEGHARDAGSIRVQAAVAVKHVAA